MSYSVTTKTTQQLFNLLANIEPQHFTSIQGYFQHFSSVPSYDYITQIYRNALNAHQTGRAWDSSCLQYLDLVCLLICLSESTSPLNMHIQHWKKVGKLIFNEQWKVCQSKWLDNQARSVHDTPWTRMEDQALLIVQQKMQQLGKLNKWRQIAVEISKLCKTPYIRMGKQCRERWINKLNPQIEKSPWYKDEELKLFESIKLVGKKWSFISREYFNNCRSENSLKNRYYSTIKRRNQMEAIKMNEQLERQFIDMMIKELSEKVQFHSDRTSAQSNLYFIQPLTSQMLKDLISDDFDTIGVAVIRKSKRQISLVTTSI